MTESEAINRLVDHFRIHNDGRPTPYLDEAVSMAINALKKQIPKKIVYRKQTYGTPWLCPVCEAEQIKVEFFNDDGSQPKEKHSFCWKCGHKMDWAVIEHDLEIQW